MMQRVVPSALLLAFLLACSASKMGRKAETESPKSRDEQHYVEDFDPLSLDDDDIVIAPAEKESPQPESASEPVESTLSVDVERTETMALGYRVQILATKDEQKAREEKRRAILSLPEKVYLIFESPYYRLRVGDCVTRKQAEELRDSIVRIGNRDDKFAEWRDAWIVKSRINQDAASPENM